MSDRESQRNSQDQESIGGVPTRILDGYDGGQEPPAEFIAKLLASAPPEVQARAKAFAEEQAARSPRAD